MKSIRILISLIILGDILLAEKQPNHLFNILLKSNVSELKGNTQKARGIVRFGGITYNLYSVDNKFYYTNDEDTKIMVQAKKSDGSIASIIGEYKLPKSECMDKLEQTKTKIESNLKIKFETIKENNIMYYLFNDNSRMMVLLCEIKSDSTLRVMLRDLE